MSSTIDMVKSDALPVTEALAWGRGTVSNGRRFWKVVACPFCGADHLHDLGPDAEGIETPDELWSLCADHPGQRYAPREAPFSPFPDDLGDLEDETLRVEMSAIEFVSLAFTVIEYEQRGLRLDFSAKNSLERSVELIERVVTELGDSEYLARYGEIRRYFTKRRLEHVRRLAAADAIVPF